MRLRRYLFIISVILFTFVFMSPKVLAEDESIPNLKGISFTNVKKEITLNDVTYVVFSTNETVYFLNEYEIDFSIDIQDVLFLEIIEDVNGNNYDEILIITSSRTKDNIRLYDSKNLELIYSYMPKLEAYHFSIGYYDEAVTVDDYKIEGKEGVFLSGYNVFKIDFKELKIVWEFKGNNNLWDLEPIEDINDDGVTDYMVSIEYSDVISISGKTGEKIYQTYVSGPIFLMLKEIKTNIWSLQYDDEEKIVYAASENGHIYIIEVETGAIYNFYDILQLDYSHIHHFYKNNNRGTLHKKFYIELVEDLDENGVRDIVYYQMQSGAIYFLSGEYLLNYGGELRLTERNFDVYSTIRGYKRGIYQEEDVIFLVDYDLEYSYYNILSLKELKYVGLIDYYAKGELYDILPLSNGDILRFHKRGLSKYNGSTDELLFSIKSHFDFKQSQNQLLVLEGNTGNAYTSLRMVDVNTNELLWDYQTESIIVDVVQGAGISNGYMEDLILFSDFTKDMNQDGVSDVVLVLKKFGEIPSICTIDGKTGTIMGEHSIVIPKDDMRYHGQEMSFSEYQNVLSQKRYTETSISEFKPIKDINGDGIDDYYVINGLGEIYFFDMTTNTLITAFTSLYQSDEKITFIKSQKSSMNYSNIEIMNDLYNDSISDFVIRHSAAYSTYNFTKDEIGYKIEYKGTTQLDYEEGYKTNYIGDIDNDGINDFAYFLGDTFISQAIIVSSKTGEKMDVTNPYTLYTNNQDINDDEFLEAITATKNGNKLRVNILDVKTNNTLYQSDAFFIKSDFLWRNDGTPIVSFKNNEGELNVALLLSNKDRTKYKLHIYDLDNNLLDEITLGTEIEEVDNEINHYSSMKSIEYNGKTYIYGKIHNGTYKSYIYNLTDSKLITLYNGDIQNISFVGDKLILKDKYKQNPFIADYTNHIHISNTDDLENNLIVDHNFKIDFANKKEGVVNIYVDNYLVGHTFEDSYTLKLLDGNHEIMLSQIDENGVEIFYKFHVNVPKPLLYSLGLPLTTAVAFIFTVYFTWRKRKYNVPQFNE